MRLVFVKIRKLGREPMTYEDAEITHDFHECQRTRVQR